MTTQKATCYVCLAGHVDAVPSMGMYLSCQVPVSIEWRGQQRGFAPCNNAIVEVPDPDGALEAAYRVGGIEAAKLVIQGRTREGAPASVGTAR